MGAHLHLKDPSPLLLSRWEDTSPPGRPPAVTHSLTPGHSSSLVPFLLVSLTLTNCCVPRPPSTHSPCNCALDSASKSGALHKSLIPLRCQGGHVAGLPPWLVLPNPPCLGLALSPGQEAMISARDGGGRVMRGNGQGVRLEGRTRGGVCPGADRQDPCPGRPGGSRRREG